MDDTNEEALLPLTSEVLTYRSHIKESLDRLTNLVNNNSLIAKEPFLEELSIINQYFADLHQACNNQEGMRDWQAQDITYRAESLGVGLKPAQIDRCVHKINRDHTLCVDTLIVEVFNGN
jgi:hypothetical protein